MKSPNNLGAKPKSDPKERRVTRSLPLNDYEYEALKKLTVLSKAKSVGAHIVARFNLPSTAAAADKFNSKLPS